VCWWNADLLADSANELNDFEVPSSARFSHRHHIHDQILGHRDLQVHTHLTGCSPWRKAWIDVYTLGQDRLITFSEPYSVGPAREMRGNAIIGLGRGRMAKFGIGNKGRHN
jgi:hypothetical protein